MGSGHVVIHRIVGGDAKHGFIMQGDHNSTPDPWLPKQAEMADIASFRLAAGGRVVSTILQPVILGGLASAIVVTVLLARPPRPPGRRRASWGLGFLTTRKADPSP